MFATVSKDGYLNLYIMPSFSLVRSIKLSTKKQIHKKEVKKEEIIKDDKEDKKEGNNESIKEGSNESIKEDIIDTNTKDTKDKKDENNTPISGDGDGDNIEKNEERKEVAKEEGELGEISTEKKNEIKEENKNENIINDNKDKDKENKNDGKNNNIINDGHNQDDDNDDNEEEEEEEEEEQLYADKVFLSSSPLACVTVYISKKRLFRTYTINGEFVGEVEEPDATEYIKSPVIFKNLYFEDFLIYGTDRGFVKIRAFPKMNKIVDSLNVSSGSSVEIVEISKDKRYCAVWSKNNELNIIKDVGVFSLNLSDNIAMMGFNIGK